MNTKRLFCFIALIVASGYFSACDTIYGDIFNDDTLLNNLYINSTDTLTMGSNKLISIPYVYRNFMPGVLPRNSGLTVSVYIVDIDSVSINPSLEINSLHVIHDGYAWRSSPNEDQHSSISDYGMRVASTDGPEWNLDSNVDVILEIADGTTSTKYYLIKRNLKIEKVE